MVASAKAVHKKKVKIDFNLLPDEYQRRFRLKTPHVLLILLGLGLVFNIVLYQAKKDLNEQSLLLNRQLRTTQNENKKLVERQSQAKDLKAGIEKAKLALAQKKDDFQAFQAQKKSWTTLVNTVTKAPDISLASLSQRGDSIVLKGSASNIIFIQDYINYLYSSGLFSEASPFTELKSRSEIAFIINLKVKLNGQRKTE